MPLTITLNQPTEKIGSQVLELMRVLKVIQSCNREEKIILDFKNISFVHPLFILSLAALDSQFKHKKFTTERDTSKGWWEINSSLNTYLSSIYFPSGLMPDENSTLDKILDSYKGKSFIGIIV